MQADLFTTEQILGILHEVETSEQTVGEVCRAHNIATTTLYRWRKKFGGMNVPEAQRLDTLERENARLKRLLAERDLELDVVKELLGKKS